MTASMTASKIAFVFLCVLRLTEGYAMIIRPAHPLRNRAARMQSPPSPLDAVYCFDFVFGGGSKKAKLALTQVPSEKKGLVAFWRFAHEHQAGGTPQRLARAEQELRAELALAADASVFGAYLNGVDGEEHGLALVRFENGSGSASDIMIIHNVLISPCIMPDVRSELKEVVLKSLRALGSAHQMNVRLWSDFDV